MHTYVFDIDGTLCSYTNGHYEKAVPITSRIEIVNQFYLTGNQIIIFTARGMGTFDNNIDLAIAKWYSFTVNQLNRWAVQYHKLYFGKPAGDFYVDDKAWNDKSFFDFAIKNTKF